MTTAFAAVELGRRFGSTWALRDCSFEVPRGSVTALVGPNGAGKTTLLEIAVGILVATEGDVTLLGEPANERVVSRLGRVGFVAQDAPLYRTFSVLEMLRFGRHMNPGWDEGLARSRLQRLRIPLDRKCAHLSGGQQAQVALTVAVAKRPEILFLDEPVARLDPLARREFLESLMEIVADGEVTVMLSSHLIADLERVSDHLVLLSSGHVLVAGETERLLSQHCVLSGPRHLVEAAARTLDVVDGRSAERLTTMLVRGEVPFMHPDITVSDVDLEELVLGYLRARQAPQASPEPQLAETRS
ncbi:MAG: ABC transporter ATP-binding protein [Candidatus Dormibacteria bacterium]